jgi:LDH2 family malate/lactate/ureidoglycolate dehydrogenase
MANDIQESGLVVGTRDAPPPRARVVSAREQIETLSAIFLGLGATEAESSVQADVLTEADLRGVHSHGLQRLPVLVARIRNGLLKVAVEPTRIWPTDSVLCVDGKDGFGPAVAESSLRAAVGAARAHGVCVVAIRQTSHIGMLGYYSRHRAAEGLICIGFSTSEPLVHPHGGAEALIGTNPLTIGIPSAPCPFVLDMATSIVPMGKILTHLHRGVPLDEGWAIDADGEPTTDPLAASLGSIAPVGGPKGSGLGVAIGILAGLLTGAEIGRAVRGTLDVEHRCTKGDLFLLLDPAAFPGGPGLVDKVRSYLDELRSSRPQRGFEQVVVAGDRGDEMRRQRLVQGIPHPEEVWHAAEEIRASITC